MRTAGQTFGPDDRVEVRAKGVTLIGCTVYGYADVVPRDTPGGLFITPSPPGPSCDGGLSAKKSRDGEPVNDRGRSEDAAREEARQQRR